jgi:hypothetical protein
MSVSTVGNVSCWSDRSFLTRLDAICTSNSAGSLPCRPFLNGRRKNSSGWVSCIFWSRLVTWQDWLPEYRQLIIDVQDMVEEHKAQGTWKRPGRAHAKSRRLE